MEPEIRYVRSADDVSIAYWKLGEGEQGLVVLPPLAASHIGLEWQYEPLRTWYETLAEGRLIVRYDWRGQGMSDRHISNISLGPMLSDIDAVTERVGLSRYAIIANGTKWQLAVACALNHPERVSHLVLIAPVRMWTETPQVRARRQMFDASWEEYTEIVARLFLDRRQVHEVPLYAQFIRQAVAPDVWSLFLDLAASGAWDVEASLGDVQAPALVIIPPATSDDLMELPRKLASRIPDGRLLVPARGSASALGLADLQGDVRSAIDNFLGGRIATASDTPSGTATILFADIAGHTALTVRIGDAAFREKARPLDEAMRIAVRDHGGTVVDGKTLGDGILATFPSASQAIAAAFTLEAAAAPTGLGLHIGLHAGDVLREVDADGRSNVFGSAVSIASRISALAPPGEILVSRTVADLARTSASVTFEDRGEHALKGVGEPQRVYAVRKDA